MRLTTKSRYAIRSLMELASAPEGIPLTLGAIAHRQRIKVKYLEQIFLRLHRAGLVASRKGPGGGYRLARAPRRITLLDVVRAAGESTALVLCALDRKDKYCAGIRSCALQDHWKRLKMHIDTFLEGVTIADICGPSRRSNRRTKGRKNDEG